MKVRFSVVSFAPPGVSLAVIGSTESLGKWNPNNAVPLTARLADTRLRSEPDFHSADIEIQSNEPIEYKFVERGSGVKWEDLGGQKNRIVKLDKLDEDAHRITYRKNEANEVILLLPVERFAEPGGSEGDHTARFYQGVKERGEISVQKILRNLFVGSCPRQRSHIDYLHSLGITTVFNFQTEEDCKRNCVAGIGMEEDPLAVSKIYESKGMQYIWMPTFDMSTDGRAQMLPQASFLIVEVLRRGHVVYSHCNAGVGRSVAAACGYLTFCLGLSYRQMQHVVAMHRPVAFFDFEAMERARPHYTALFGKMAMEKSGEKSGGYPKDDQDGGPDGDDAKSREEALETLAL